MESTDNNNKSTKDKPQNKRVTDTTDAVSKLKDLLFGLDYPLKATGKGSGQQYTILAANEVLEMVLNDVNLCKAVKSKINQNKNTSKTCLKNVNKIEKQTKMKIKKQINEESNYDGKICLLINS
jgi:hypothetical protein